MASIAVLNSQRVPLEGTTRKISETIATQVVLQHRTLVSRHPAAHPCERRAAV